MQLFTLHALNPTILHLITNANHLIGSTTLHNMGMWQLSKKLPVGLSRFFFFFFFLPFFDKLDCVWMESIPPDLHCCYNSDL